MTPPRWHLPSGTAHAARVALAASLLIGLVYVGCVLVLDNIAAARLVAAVDARLHDRLAFARSAGLFTRGKDDGDVDEAPVFLWLVNPPRRPVALRAGEPALPPGFVPPVGRPLTEHLGSGDFRFAAIRYRGGLLLVGQSLAEQDRLEAVLRDGEVLAAPVLLLAVFIGSLVIALRALAPVERSRRRQLEFTADASHELRTPLSVIGAETDVALSAARRAADYRAALSRIKGETERLRAIVEDLLWLARFDSKPPPPRNEPLVLATIASECGERFTALARAGSIEISVSDASAAVVQINAPAEWIHRLVGVLVDNACRFAGAGGKVRITVSHRGNRATLTVEDSGPGIPAQERDRLFDRFHRSTERGGAAGLGLAIADSIVESTSGQWRIGSSALGGALFEVSWRKS